MKEREACGSNMRSVIDGNIGGKLQVLADEWADYRHFNKQTLLEKWSAYLGSM